MKNITFPAFLLLLAALTFAATVPAPQPSVPSGSLVDGTRVIEVTAKKYAFVPDPIVVNQGEKVRLMITAVDVDHGFGLTAYKINKTLPKGQVQTVEFVADKAGTFPIHCTVFCGMGHMGMKASLIVLAGQTVK